MGVDVPIINAPMGGAAGGRLAAAVSEAGALGMIGMGSSATAATLDSELRVLGALEKPFGIGLVHWVMAAEPELLEVALAARPALLCVSFGDEWSWVQRAHDAGVTAATQVADVDAALRAVDAGVDVLVARGAEGGGHGQPSVGTLPLVCELLDRVSVPVLAAGGIASGRGLAAVLAAGAAGAWLGTVFCTCTEALTSDVVRQALVDADSDTTVLTRVFDVAQGYPWPASIPERVLRNDFVDQWDGRDSGLTDGARRALSTAMGTDDLRLAPVNAGQGVGMVAESRSAAEVIERLRADASTLLARWSVSASGDGSATGQP